jgi:hypothetical protein
LLNFISSNENCGVVGLLTLVASKKNKEAKIIKTIMAVLFGILLYNTYYEYNFEKS